MATALVEDPPAANLTGAANSESHPLPVTICIGDLHGHVVRAKNLWANLKQRVGEETFEKCTVIFLGDYCDRGPNTKDLLDWLVSLKEAYPKQTQVFLAGNHDFSFAAFTGCIPPVPQGFSFQETWGPLAKDEEKEGWYKGPGYQDMHVQGRRWAGVMKDKMCGTKGRMYDISTFDSGSTFRSYGVEFADRDAMIQAMPQSHKDFLRDLVWVHEQGGLDTGDPATSYTKLIAVHAGLEAGHPAEDLMKKLRQRQPTMHRLEEISGRKNVIENLPELEEDNVLVVSGHHGKLDTTRRLRLIIDESGGLDFPIAAIILPSREIVHDTDQWLQAAPILDPPLMGSGSQ